MPKPMSGQEAIEWCQHMRNAAKGYDKQALEQVVDMSLGYIIGMSAADYQRVQLWIKSGMKKPADTAFTAGPARQCGRLIELALSEKEKQIGKKSKVTTNSRG